MYRDLAQLISPQRGPAAITSLGSPPRPPPSSAPPPPRSTSPLWSEWTSPRTHKTFPASVLAARRGISTRCAASSRRTHDGPGVAREPAVLRAGPAHQAQVGGAGQGERVMHVPAGVHVGGLRPLPGQAD